MQLQDLYNWIDSPQDFYQGVELYNKYGSSEFLKKLFAKGESSFTVSKLEESINDIIEQYKKENLSLNNEKDPEPQKKRYTQKVFNIADPIPNQLQLLKNEKAILFKELLQLRKELKKYCSIPTQSSLTVAECCKIMEKKDALGNYIPFSITYVTYNSREAYGGELITYKHATLASLNHSGSKINTSIKPKKVSKNPNHWKNSTRNIHPEKSWEIRKLNIWLMLEFNGREVVVGDAG